MFTLTDGRLLSAEAVKGLQFFSPEVYLVTIYTCSLFFSFTTVEFFSIFVKHLIPLENLNTCEKDSCSFYPNTIIPGVSGLKLETRNLYNLSFRLQSLLMKVVLTSALPPHSSPLDRIRHCSSGFPQPPTENGKHLSYILLHDIVTVYIWATFEDIFFMIVYPPQASASAQ